MKVRVPINTESDLSMGLGSHYFWLPPVIPTPIPAPAMEMVVNMKWPPGFAMNKNKLTTTVTHQKKTVVQAGHDCGVMIPDLLIVPPCIPIPTNAYYYIMWPLSSRKTTFLASTVKANKKPVACANLGTLMPMISCGNPVSLPLTVPITNGSNTVTVGVGPVDILQGALSIYLSVAIGAVFASLSKGGAKVVLDPPKEILEKLLKHVLLEMLKKHLKFLPKPDKANRWFAKKAIKAVVGGQPRRITGEPKYKIRIGIPYVGVELEIKKDKRKGWRAKIGGNVLGWKRDSSGGGADWGTKVKDDNRK